MKTTMNTVAVLLLIFCSYTALAQQDPTDPGSAVGVPALTPMDGVLDNVNLTNGNVNFSIPLVSLKGRGGLDLSIAMEYDSKLLSFAGIPLYDENGTTYDTLASWASNSQAGTRTPAGGRLTIPTLRADWVYTGSNGVYSTYCLTGFVFTEANGATHNFAAGNNQPVSSNCGFATEHGWVATPMYETHVGQSWNFAKSPGTPDGANYSIDLSNASDLLVHLPTGITIHFAALAPNLSMTTGDNLPSKIEDSNGNFIQFANIASLVDPANPVFGYYPSETDIYDTLNRKVAIQWPNPTQNDTITISYKNSDGSAQNITIAGTADFYPSGPQHTADCGYPMHPEITTYTGYGGNDVISQLVGGATETYRVIANGSEITDVKLPDGGSIHYAGSSYPANIDGCLTDIREIGSRTVSAPSHSTDLGAGLTQLTTYTAGIPLGYHVNKSMDVYEEYSTSSMYGGGTSNYRETKHFFGPYQTQGAWTYIDATAENETDVMDTTTVNGMLRKIKYLYTSPYSCGSIPSEVDTTLMDAADQPTSRVQIDLMSTCSPIAQATRVYGYDGTLLRSTAYTYWNYPTFTNKVASIVVTGDGGNSSSTVIEYDNYSRQSPITASTVVHRDPAVTMSGNPTMVTTGGISTYKYYDYAGNLTKWIDGRGFATDISYADQWGDSFCANSGTTLAYPTLVTNALNQTTGAWYNSCTGTASQKQDLNGHYTQVTGYDAHQRPLGVTYPDGGQVQTSYVTANGGTIPASIVTTSILMNSSGQHYVTQSELDGLGRPVSQQVTSAPNGPITTLQVYDGYGNIQSAVNPRDNTGGGEVTAWSYDGLGRKITQLDSDQDGTILWCYNGSGQQGGCHPRAANVLGEWVDETDEDGNDHQRITDALGRLVSVIEPGGLQTNYTYDALGNLKTVVQNGLATETPRVRSFTYDSLSRLVTAQNPETGLTCYGTVPGGGVPTVANCVASYDNNGNLLHKTDSNGTQLDYYYDPLNRLTLQNSGIDANAVFVYHYDDATNGVGRLSYEYNYFGYAGTTFNYDVMGRIKSTTWLDIANGRWIPGMDVDYDYMGNTTELTYPDMPVRRIVKQEWDTAARLSSVTDYTGGVPGTIYANNMQYTAAGALAGATYGNGVTESLAYNERMQLYSATANSSALPSAVSGANLYDRTSYYTANGNISAIVDNVRATSQNFAYDPLNRLQTAFQSDGAYNQSFNIDSFGNMLPQDNLYGNLSYTIDAATNRLALNGDLISGDLKYDAAGHLAFSPGHSYWWTADGNLRAIDAYQTGSYLYNGSHERTLTVHNNTSWNENVYLNGLTMSDLNDKGGWSDYIYANGQKIAKVDSTVPLLHVHGTTDAGAECGAGMAASYLIKSGDRVMWKEYKQNAYGGLAFFTAQGGAAAWGYTDTAGNTINDDGHVNQWVSRTFDLSAFAGQTLNQYQMLHDLSTGASTWDLWASEITVVSTDGTATPLIGPNGASIINSGCGAPTPTVYGENQAQGTAPGASGAVGAHYYVADHLGTTQMELSSGGWPLWKGQFTPFGQEIGQVTPALPVGAQNPDGTSMRYKFTGKERDIESGLDYFPARYYASSMGRWMSPDPTGISYSDPRDPQSLNMYAYVGNRPLLYTDPLGLSKDCGGGGDKSVVCLVTSAWDWLKDHVGGGGGGGGASSQTGNGVVHESVTVTLDFMDSHLPNFSGFGGSSGRAYGFGNGVAGTTGVDTVLYTGQHGFRHPFETREYATLVTTGFTWPHYTQPGGRMEQNNDGDGVFAWGAGVEGHVTFGRTSTGIEGTSTSRQLSANALIFYGSYSFSGNWYNFSDYQFSLGVGSHGFGFTSMTTTTTGTEAGSHF